jgi:hypothetical protein
VVDQDYFAYPFAIPPDVALCCKAPKGGKSKQQAAVLLPGGRLLRRVVQYLDGTGPFQEGAHGPRGECHRPVCLFIFHVAEACFVNNDG